MVMYVVLFNKNIRYISVFNKFHLFQMVKYIYIYICSTLINKSKNFGTVLPCLIF